MTALYSKINGNGLAEEAMEWEEPVTEASGSWGHMFTAQKANGLEMGLWNP